MLGLKVTIEHDRLYIRVYWRGGVKLTALDPPRDLMPDE